MFVLRALKSLVYTASFSLYAAFIATVAGWLIIGGAEDVNVLVKIFSVTFGAAFVIIAAAAAVISAVTIKKGKKLEKTLCEKGYCDEYYEALRKRCEKRFGAGNFQGRISLAAALCDGERYDEAIAEMKAVDISGASEEMLAEYYNAYLYILLMAQDMESCEIAAAAGEEYLQKFSEKKSFGGEILHTLGVLEYARGNYGEAEKLLMKAKKGAKLRYTENACNMYLALVFLKTDRKEQAKKLTLETISYVTNPRQKEDLKKLMRLVEKAYGMQIKGKEIA